MTAQSILLKVLSVKNNLTQQHLVKHHNGVATWVNGLTSVANPLLTCPGVTAAVLHDVGKVEIPDEIIMKPGPLSRHEWKLMNRHPAVGARLLNQFKNQIAPGKNFSLVTKAIRHHHERWDGTGYPDGLKGEEIPFLARVLAIADAFDAMTGWRPYKKSLSIEDARQEIIRCAGTHFDPVLARIFVDILDNIFLLSQKAKLAPAQNEYIQV
jgi:HD-GYP domain-containing protein (c-di-GMP phosphodiesterase class II)